MEQRESGDMACHHSPNEAGEFASDSGSGDVVWTGESDSFEFAFRALIGFVGIAPWIFFRFDLGCSIGRIQ